VRADVVPRRQGDMVIFAINHRTVKSTNGFSQTAMRHGVSTIRRRSRMTLGAMRQNRWR
jgi:hypothetical protein